MTRDQMLERITAYYLESGDFNGLVFDALIGDVDPQVATHTVATLITDGLVAAVFGDGHANPHIRALPDHHSAQRQIELLEGGGKPCLYPLPKHLESVVDRPRYDGRP